MKHLFQKLHLVVLSLLMGLMASCITGCKEKRPLGSTFEIRHNFMERQEAAKSAEELLPYIDSLYREGIIGKAESELMRGHAYNTIDKADDLAAEHYKKSYDLFCQESHPISDLFAESAFRSTLQIAGHGNLEGASHIITETLSRLEDKEDFSERWKSSLYMDLASYHVRLGLIEEAKQTYEKAYQSKVKVIEQKLEPPIDLIVICVAATEMFFEKSEYETADLWRERLGTALQNYNEELKAMHLDEAFNEFYQFSKMRALVAKGKKEDAIQLYKTAPKDALLHSSGLCSMLPTFLEEAGLFKEAADMFDKIDVMHHNTPTGRTLSFETFADFYAPRYRVYKGAGRMDVASGLADSVFNNIDSAMVRLRKDQATELVTIYHTHEKELELKDAQAETRIHRLLLCGTGLIILLIGYLLLRTYQHNQELRAKNRSLFEQMEKREQEEQDKLNTLQALPIETLSSDQQLYSRLCRLMAEKQPYTEETLNRDSLAQMLGTNEKYVVQAIHECSHGETVTDFITRYRLEHVARLLRTTDEPVNLIGEMSGIPSRATLARLFRNTYGMTCSEYRQVATRPGKA